MAHEIDTAANGKARMFYAGETPWHGLGQAVEKEVTAEAAIQLAELDWEVELRDLYLGHRDENGNEMLDSLVPNRKAVVRKDSGNFLGAVGTKYYPIQNREIFSFLDEVVGEGQAVYHTAGSLRNGSRIFITLKLPESMEIGPDKIDKYLVFMAGHDGTMSVHGKWTPVRVVCMNTASAAFEGNTDRRINSDIKIRHTPNYREKISLARDALGLANAYYKQAEEVFNRLLDKPISDINMHKFVGDLFPGEIQEDDTYKITKGIQKNRDKVEVLFHEGIGQNAVANTGWAAYNAVTEYVDHHRGSRVREGQNAKDVRFDSIMVGAGEELRQQAMNLLLSDIPISTRV